MVAVRLVVAFAVYVVVLDRLVLVEVVVVDGVAAAVF